ncbi:MAG TPA: GNAT family N-acetyltransferase [Caulobacteraceae bacterium]
MRIAPFEQSFAPAFKALNEAWIRQHFVLEPKDAEILEDPAGKIVAAGGQVLFAIEDGAVVGCCALMAMADGGFELAKMAVAEAAQGRGFAKALLAAAVDAARAAGAPRIYLESNASLTPALTLYRRFGFTDVPLERRTVSPYARADVWMELDLAATGTVQRPGSPHSGDAYGNRQT